MKLSHYVFLFCLIEHCWLLKERLYKGRDCTTEEAARLVSIQDSFRDNHCGGSLIKKEWVLTAGHCCRSINNTHVFGDPSTGYKVRVGSPFWEREYTRLYHIEKVHLHPNYSQRPVWSNDVCLLQLNESVKLDKTVKLNILATTAQFEKIMEDGSCKDMLTMGFGYQKKELPITDLWDQLPPSVSTIPPVTFPPYYGDSTFNPWVQCNNMEMIARDNCRVPGTSIGENTFCAKDRTPTGTMFCGGDSGGPSFCGNLQVGFVSAYGPCGDPEVPSIYMRVDTYRDYITKLAGQLRAQSATFSCGTFFSPTLIPVFLDVTLYMMAS